MPKTIYLDNHSTAQPSEGVLEAMRPFLTEKWGIPSAPHIKGQELSLDLKHAYTSIYEALSLDDKDCFILTSSGTEAVNHVIQGVFHEISRHTGKNHFLCASTDEASAILAIGQLEKQGVATGTVPADREGYVTAAAVADEISPRTALISLSWVNALTGVINPVEEIIELCHGRGILVHLDVTHALGKLYVDLSELGADFITFNGEQVHGPRSTGGLVIRGGKLSSPYIVGSSDQAGMRGGALDVGTLVGLACALKEATEQADHVSMELARLRDKFESGLQKKVPEIQLCFEQSERLPNCSAFLFPGVSNDALLYSLSQQGLCACFGGGNFQRIALILEASHIEPELAQTALSFALSRFSSEQEIDDAIELIAFEYERLSKMSISIHTPSDKEKIC